MIVAPRISASHSRVHRAAALLCALMLATVELAGALHVPSVCDPSDARVASGTIATYSQACDTGRCCSGEEQDTDECAGECGDGCHACSLHTPLRSVTAASVIMALIPSSRFIYSHSSGLLDLDLPAPELPPRA